MYIPKRKKIIKWFVLLLILAIVAPPMTSGAVKPIEEVESKLEGITAEEQEVLVKLFGLQQEIEGTKQQERILSEEIVTLQGQINKLEADIDNKQEEYEHQLEILKKVLVNYQRGGPANYLELLLSADSLTSFLKSMNILKDLSRNVGELLGELEEGKKLLEARRQELDTRVIELRSKQEELLNNLHKSEQLKQELEVYLDSLQEERQGYEEQLMALETMWKDNKALFQNIMTEFSQIISAGSFTMENLNLKFSLFSMSGFIEEETFNTVLNENSDLPDTIFRFEEDKVTLEVPEKQLVLTGNFIKVGDSAIEYAVDEGTFYGVALETAAINELFAEGPLSMDFQAIAEDMVSIKFTLSQVQSREGKLTFEIKPVW